MNPNEVNAGGDVSAGPTMKPNVADANEKTSEPTHTGTPNVTPDLDATNRQQSDLEWYRTSTYITPAYLRPEFIRNDIYWDMIDRRNAYMRNNGVTERPDSSDGIFSEY
jgi:hypothetical protein